jgi:fructuronate reductase
MTPLPRTAALPRLSASTLHRAAKNVRLLGYDRAALRGGIVHLGLGAFARAHLAEYTDDALARVAGDWGITGVSLQRPDQRDRLAPQDGLYTALQRDGAGTQARIIGCVQRVLVAPEVPQAVVAAMADPTCRIVTLTVTEKGYCHDPASGRLDFAHPDILADLAHPATPRSAIGLIVTALERRRAARLSPFTVMCCDNLPQNGRLLARLVDEFARRRNADLADWIAAKGAFPCTMVDRIVPATTDADVTAASEVVGLLDLAVVVHEPFRQWVIEDRFVSTARPAWQEVGAQFVPDVAPYEHMKLRVLNAAHSALAYLGYLSGRETIVEAVSDSILRRFVLDLWREEIIPVLTAPAGINLSAYSDRLMRRFENPAILHRTWQIAADGSQKLPQRLLDTIRERLARQLPITRLAHVVAAWIRYVGGIDETGKPIDVRDPLAALLRTTLEGAGQAPEERVARMIALKEIFGDDLTDDKVFRAAVTEAYTAMLEHGVRDATLAQLAP